MRLPTCSRPSDSQIVGRRWGVPHFPNQLINCFMGLINPFSAVYFWQYFWGIGLVSFKDITVISSIKKKEKKDIYFNACYWHEEIFFFKNNFNKFQNLVPMVTNWLKFLDTINFSPFSPFSWPYWEKKAPKKSAKYNRKPVCRPCPIQQRNNIPDLKHNDYWYPHINR